MAFENDEKYDNILLDVIQHVSNLPNFLDILFGFLRRRCLFCKNFKTFTIKLELISFTQ